MKEALEKCLDAMLRMIPEACARHGLEQLTEAEHDEAILAAASTLYGEDRAAWPAPFREVAGGAFE